MAYDPKTWNVLRKRISSYGRDVPVSLLRTWFDELSQDTGVISPASQQETTTQTGIKSWESGEMGKAETEAKSALETLKQKTQSIRQPSILPPPDTGRLGEIEGEIRNWDRELNPWREQANIYSEAASRVSGIYNSGNDEDIRSNRDYLMSIGFRPHESLWDSNISEWFPQLRASFNGWTRQLSQAINEFRGKWESEGKPIEDRLRGLQDEYNRQREEIAGESVRITEENQRATDTYNQAKINAEQEFLSGQQAISRELLSKQKNIGSQTQARLGAVRSTIETQEDIGEERKKQRLSSLWR